MPKLVFSLQDGDVLANSVNDLLRNVPYFGIRIAAVKVVEPFWARRYMRPVIRRDGLGFESLGVPVVVVFSGESHRDFELVMSSLELAIGALDELRRVLRNDDYCWSDHYPEMEPALAAFDKALAELRKHPKVEITHHPEEPFDN